MVMTDLAQFIEQYHRSVGSFLQGDLEPQKRLWSRRDDVTLANPLGPPARGWRQVEDALDRAASQIHGGEVVSVERISEVATSELAYIVEIERERVKIGSADTFAASSLRVTSIFRREDGQWRLIHRHADPITAPRSIESVLEQ
jgi:ketosteroid isomerase-like protein